MKLSEWLEWKSVKKGDLAKQLGIHQSHISHLLNGERCSPSLAFRIEQATEGHVTKESLVWPE